VGFLGIIPDEISHQFSVKVIWLVEVIKVVIDALLLDGAVKSLQEAI
jgi:hypothetical protein